MKLLLEKNDVDPNVRDNFGCTPLASACLHKNIAIVRSLLSRHDIDPSIVDNIISQVMNNGHDEEIEYLLHTASARRMKARGTSILRHGR